MEFHERTIKIIIDESKCDDCTTHACADACKTFSRGILGLKEGKPAVKDSADELVRKGTECLACEYACWLKGKGAITIEAPIKGLSEYRQRHGTN